MLGQLPDDPLIEAPPRDLAFPTPRQSPAPGCDCLLAPGGADLELMMGWPVQRKHIIRKGQLAAQLLQRSDQALRFCKSIDRGRGCGHNRGLLNPSVL